MDDIALNLTVGMLAPGSITAAGWLAAMRPRTYQRLAPYVAGALIAWLVLLALFPTRPKIDPALPAGEKLELMRSELDRPWRIPTAATTILQALGWLGGFYWLAELSKREKH